MNGSPMPSLIPPYAYWATSTGEVDSMLQKLLIGNSNSLKLPPLCNWNSLTNMSVLQFTATLVARALRTRIRSPEDLPSRDATRNLSPMSQSEALVQPGGHKLLQLEEH